jgi:hypothetical protein
MSADRLALFEGHKYINLTTFRKNGQAVPTPVWFVVRDGRLYVYPASRPARPGASAPTAGHGSRPAMPVATRWPSSFPPGRGRLN